MAKSRRAVTAPRRAPSRKPQVADRVDRAVDRKVSDSTRPAAVEIDLPEEGIGSAKFWCDAIEASRQRTDKEVDIWKPLLDAYAGGRARMENLATSDEQININVGFYHVEQKIPNLFFQTPALQVTPRVIAAQASAPIVQAVMNSLIGLDGIDAKSLIDELLRDCLITSGFGASKIGYSAVTQKVSEPTGRLEPAIDPLTQTPMADPVTGQPQMTEALNPDGTPETKDVERVIWDEIYWRRIAPENLLLPASFLSTRYDEAPWIGFRFFADREQLSRDYGLDAGALADVNFDKLVVTARDLEAIKSQPVACGYEIWYRASYVDPKQPNPERIRRLVILETGGGGRGEYATEVRAHGDSPYQTFKPTGEFQAGMKGFPIHPLCFRSRPNTAFPGSDCYVLKDVAHEKNLARTQMIQQRKRNLPMSGFNKSKIDVNTIAQIERGSVQSLIGFDGPVSDDDLRPLRNAAFPPENFSFDRINQQDIDRLGASGANNQGLGNENADTATEATIIARATETRLANERNNVLGWLTRGAGKLLGLLQLTAREEQLVEMVGPDGAKQFATWNREAIQGEYAFKVRPDSSVRLDAAQEREKTLRLYNLTANAPGINHTELLRAVVEAFGYDPTKLVGQPQPAPQPEPDKPKVSVNLKGEDLNPAAPQYVNVTKLLILAGITLPPAAPPAPGTPTPPPGGRPQRAAESARPVSKHDANLTGQPVGRPV
jgi:hypothetical protein